MTIKARTIDNLGVDASSRYARDQKNLDRRLIDESRSLPRMSETPSTAPYVISEYEDLFSSRKTTTWASFAEPANFYGVARSIFTFQVLPSLGSEEEIQEDLDKIEALEGSMERESDEDRGRKKMVALLRLLREIDRNLSLINGKRNQYQRG